MCGNVPNTLPDHVVGLQSDCEKAVFKSVFRSVNQTSVYKYSGKRLCLKVSEYQRTLLPPVKQKWTPILSNYMLWKQRVRAFRSHNLWEEFIVPTSTMMEEEVHSVSCRATQMFSLLLTRDLLRFTRGGAVLGTTWCQGVHKNDKDKSYPTLSVGATDTTSVHDQTNQLTSKISETTCVGAQEMIKDITHSKTDMFSKVQDQTVILC